MMAMIRGMLVNGYRGINVMRRFVAGFVPLVVVVRNPMAQRDPRRGGRNREACEGPQKLEASK